MDSENRFLKVPMTIWDGLQGVVAGITLFILLFGAGWGVYQYDKKVEADRVRTTLELLDVWETRGYLAAYRSLDDRVQKLLAEIPSADIESAKKNRAVEQILFAKVSSSILENEDAKDEFENLVYFFQRQHLCVEASLCSRDTTETFFKDPLLGFMKTFRSPLNKYRGGVPEFAVAK